MTVQDRGGGQDRVELGLIAWRERERERLGQHGFAACGDGRSIRG